MTLRSWPSRPGPFFWKLEMGNLVVIGAQWGDEGKGKIVDILARDADAVVRYQGGSNAGHALRHRQRGRRGPRLADRGNGSSAGSRREIREELRDQPAGSRDSSLSQGHRQGCRAIERFAADRYDRPGNWAFLCR